MLPVYVPDPQRVGVLIDHDNRVRQPKVIQILLFNCSVPTSILFFFFFLNKELEDSNHSSPLRLSTTSGAYKLTIFCQVQLSVCYSSLVSCYEN